MVCFRKYRHNQERNAHIAQLRHDPAFRVTLRILAAEHSKGEKADMEGVKAAILRAFDTLYSEHIQNLKNVKD